MRKGYKQTEVGVIPEDWGVVPLGSVAKTGSGTTPARKDSDRYFRNGNFAWVKTLDLNNSEIAATDELVTKAALDETSLNLFPPGSVLVAMYGGFNQIGRTGLLRISATVNQAITSIRPDSLRLCSEYLLSVLNYRVEHWKSVASSSRKDPNITSADIRRFPLPLPPTKAEQEAIAEALGDADALIESLEQLLAKKRQLKQGAMQKLLTGKTRLPGFEVKPGYKQTEVGMIPEDWNPTIVGRHLLRRPSYGINAAAIEFNPQYPTYLRITDITEDGRFAESTKASVSHDSAPEYMLDDGDIVFARTGASVGKSYLYNPADGVLVFAGFLIRLAADPEALLPRFLSYYSQSRPYWKWVERNSMRSGQPGINGRELASLPIPLPPTKAEQGAISTILSDMDSEIEKLEVRLAKNRRIKEGMMRELLTGRIRLLYQDH